MKWLVDVWLRTSKRGPAPRGDRYRQGDNGLRGRNTPGPLLSERSSPQAMMRRVGEVIAWDRRGRRGAAARSRERRSDGRGATTSRRAGASEAGGRTRGRIPGCEEAGQAELGVDLANVTGLRAPGGMISREDVEAAAGGQVPAPSSARGETRVEELDRPAAGGRPPHGRGGARRLTFTVEVDVDMTRCVALRAELAARTLDPRAVAQRPRRQGCRGRAARLPARERLLQRAWV